MASSIVPSIISIFGLEPNGFRVDIDAWGGQARIFRMRSRTSGQENRTTMLEPVVYLFEVGERWLRTADQIDYLIRRCLIPAA